MQSKLTGNQLRNQFAQKISETYSAKDFLRVVTSDGELRYPVALLEIVPFFRDAMNDFKKANPHAETIQMHVFVPFSTKKIAKFIEFLTGTELKRKKVIDHKIWSFMMKVSFVFYDRVDEIFQFDNDQWVSIGSNNDHITVSDAVQSKYIRALFEWDYLLTRIPLLKEHQSNLGLLENLLKAANTGNYIDVKNLGRYDYIVVRNTGRYDYYINEKILDEHQKLVDFFGIDFNKCVRCDAAPSVLCKHRFVRSHVGFLPDSSVKPDEKAN